MTIERDIWPISFLEDSFKDAAFALRQIRNAPRFTAVAVLSLALGIGANTAIFTLIESTLLRPIAIPHPESLRLLTWKNPAHGWVPASIGSGSPTFGTGYEQRPTSDGGLIHTTFAPRMYESFRRDSSGFGSLFAFKEFGRLTAVVDEHAEAVNCFLVSGDFYRGMEIAPVIGRPIGPDDDVRTQAGSVVLISYQYWTRRFARSPSVIGKRIILNAAPVTIIGVNPEYFTGIEPGAHFEIWAPLSLGAELTPQSAPPLPDDQQSFTVPMMARLKPGVSAARAQSMLDALFQADVDAHPDSLASVLKIPARRPRLLLQSAARGIDYLTERYDHMLFAVLGLSGLVLLIACVNVANLLLAKSAVRQREISLRLALGARRWRIARQLLGEGLLLAAMAGVAGVIFGYAARNAIPALLSASWRPNPFDTAFDPRVLLVSLGVTFLTGVLFSLAPMWQSRRVEVNDALKEGSRGTASLSKLRIGRLLVVLQVALCVLLLVGAGLCVKTFTNLRNTPLGFEPRNVLLFTLDPPRLTYSSARMTDLLTQLQQRAGRIPGIQSITFTGSRGYFGVGRGPQKPAPSFATGAYSLEVGNRFFETMGIHILGRAIDEGDHSTGPRTAVVNQEFARHFFPGEDPLGKTFRGSNDLTYQIVGVCADWRVEQFRDPVRPTFYSAWMQDPHPGNVQFEIKVAGEQSAIVRQIRDTVRAIDPNLVVADVHTELEQIESALSEERLLASLGTIFGALALLLASIGIFGVMAYAVTRRTHEIGIRIALGARPGGVARMVLRETLTLAALGVAIGVPAVLSATPVLDHFLAPGWRNSFAYGLKPDDPFLLVLAALVLVSAALFAGYLPARRAARIDPMAALRHE